MIFLYEVETTDLYGKQTAIDTLYKTYEICLFSLT